MNGWYFRRKYDRFLEISYNFIAIVLLFDEIYDSTWSS